MLTPSFKFDCMKVIGVISLEESLFNPTWREKAHLLIEVEAGVRKLIECL